MQNKITQWTLTTTYKQRSTSQKIIESSLLVEVKSFRRKYESHY
jgi:hypothetical protein